jgi:predicted MPP superfamily phosphohydrolase
MNEAYVFVQPATVAHALWLILAVVAVLVLRRAFLEPYDLEVTHPELHASSSTGSTDSTVSTGTIGSIVAPGADRPSGRLRIALLTDLHAEFLRIKPAQLHEILAAEDFDVLLFGGDLAGRHHQPTIAKPWLAAIQAAAANHQIPCYAIIGNHDSAASLSLLQDAGFKVLKNESAVLTDRSGQAWLLSGLDILKAGKPDLVQALSTIDSRGAAIPLQRRIILAHNPDTIFTFPVASAGYFLAGHFHGGQIYLPFHLEFFLLRREKVGRLGHYKGSFSLNGIACYISRGLGSVLFPLRLFSRPELPIIKLVAEN